MIRAVKCVKKIK